MLLDARLARNKDKGFVAVECYLGLVNHLIKSKASIFIILILIFFCHMDFLIIFCSHFSSQTSTNSEGSTLFSAIGRESKDFLIDWAYFIVFEVHEIIGHLVESSWGLQSVILVVIIVLLSSLNFPFYVWSGSIQLFSSIVLSPSCHEPIP